MTNMRRRATLSLLSLAGLLLLAHFVVLPAWGQESGTGSNPSDPIQLVTGTVFDKQNVPVEGAVVLLKNRPDDTVLAEDITQPDGRYALTPSELVPQDLFISIKRAHFQEQEVDLGFSASQTLIAGQIVSVPEITLIRKITPAFWIAGIVFAGVLVLIATGVIHNTLAALLGTAIVLGVSYLGEPINEGLFIFYFPRALHYVDWNVIFLIMGMMMVIAVVERTGIFQWMAYMAYRLSGGRTWLLVVILMLITGIASHF